MGLNLHKATDPDSCYCTLWEVAKAGSRTWVLAANGGDQGGTMGSWLQPDPTPASVGIWAVNQWTQDLPFFALPYQLKMLF